MLKFRFKLFFLLEDKKVQSNFFLLEDKKVQSKSQTENIKYNSKE